MVRLGYGKYSTIRIPIDYLGWFVGVMTEILQFRCNTGVYLGQNDSRFGTLRYTSDIFTDL